jgi:hypothetical protein
MHPSRKIDRGEFRPPPPSPDTSKLTGHGDDSWLPRPPSAAPEADILVVKPANKTDKEAHDGGNTGAQTETVTIPSNLAWRKQAGSPDGNKVELRSAKRFERPNEVLLRKCQKADEHLTNVPAGSYDGFERIGELSSSLSANKNEQKKEAQELAALVGDPPFHIGEWQSEEDPSLTDFEAQRENRFGHNTREDVENELSSSSVQSSRAMEDIRYNDFEPRANVVDQADLDAEVMDRILDNAVVAKVVKERSFFFKCTVAAILLVVIIAIVVGISQGTKSRVVTLPPTLAPSSSPSQMPSTLTDKCETLCQGINDSAATLTDDTIKAAILEYTQNDDNVHHLQKQQQKQQLLLQNDPRIVQLINRAITSKTIFVSPTVLSNNGHGPRRQRRRRQKTGKKINILPKERNQGVTNKTATMQHPYY